MASPQVIGGIIQGLGLLAEIGSEISKGAKEKKYKGEISKYNRRVKMQERQRIEDADRQARRDAMKRIIGSGFPEIPRRREYGDIPEPKEPNFIPETAIAGVGRLAGQAGAMISGGPNMGGKGVQGGEAIRGVASSNNIKDTTSGKNLNMRYVPDEQNKYAMYYGKNKYLG